MDCKLSNFFLNPIMLPIGKKFPKKSRATLTAHSSTRVHYKKLTKNLRYPQRQKLPPDFGVNLFLKKPNPQTDQCQSDSTCNNDDKEEEDSEEEDQKDGGIVWEPDEIEAISSLFKGRIPQKPGKLKRERPLPLPLPYKIRPLGLPTPKRHVKTASPMVASSRASISNQVYKNPRFLINLAREIRNLSPDRDVSVLLNKWGRFLRKGSLVMTIRELGHMGIPERALQTFCWAQKQPLLFPDDRILASTVEVLASNHELKVPYDLKGFINLSCRAVIEAMVRGFIRGGSLDLAWKLLSIARNCKRMLDPSIYAKMILELGKNPDNHTLVVGLLKELGEREDLNLRQQDCTALMKVCLRFRKFEIAESLFSWFKQSGHDPSVVMYTTLVRSRYSEMKYREALSVVWEMEASNCLFDLPAYRVVIKLFVALDDLSRAVRYFSRLKEAGFSPTYDIYRDLMIMYMVSGRLSKCRDVCEEAEMAGFKWEKRITSQLLQLERERRLVA
ncbi:pentatricopeptide repeat-containing protein [Tripterygium wilfordii]|uniref:Pentatricopeptide repeat-containing protein n=1 Tax=Tripterygium wilfordii TaxID=458696 RepID=A0A7J7DDU2_TRIWF|nr:pentatricopeptide repeat-containing protein At2g01860 [Tripterygium wilfordii]KAF5744439.1 pentatricopeptide repeat-containing protein [Tripterygium wilfordii]